MGTEASQKIIVAGHICLDIIPELGTVVNLGSLFLPGTLTEIGPAALATGGAVANTGLALHKLGLPVSLMAKTGNDDFGQTVLNLLERQGVPTEGMIVCPGEHTSYTVVISPPGTDRMFLHCPGANHTLCADDLDYARLNGAALFHFGYPTLMRRFYQNSGAEMKTVFERVRQHGVLTSLDMTCVDPSAEAGRVDWLRWLANVLPSVDLFLPSIDEILFMVNRPKYDELTLKHGGELINGIDAALVEQTAQILMDLGAPVVMIKLGDQGIYLRTAAVVPGKDRSWSRISQFFPCFRTEVVGTTGAGDCTIAGFLAGFVQGGTPQEAADSATGTGAFSTEAAGATTAVPHWNAVQERIAKGWKRLDSKFC